MDLIHNTRFESSSASLHGGAGAIAFIHRFLDGIKHLSLFYGNISTDGVDHEI